MYPAHPGASFSTSTSNPYAGRDLKTTGVSINGNIVIAIVSHHEPADAFEINITSSPSSPMLTEYEHFSTYYYHREYLHESPRPS